jgi:hypothetical protein
MQVPYAIRRPQKKFGSIWLIQTCYTKNSINKKLKIGLPNRTQGQGDDDLLSPNQGMYNHQYNNYVIYNCNITKY